MESDAVLEFTRGKKVLIAGGNGSKETNRVAIQKALMLEQLDWAVGEIGRIPFAKMAEGIRPGKYDFVLLLARFAGHNSIHLVRACRTHSIPVIYLPKGYSVSQITEAIRTQAIPRKNKTAENNLA